MEQELRRRRRCGRFHFTVRYSGCAPSVWLELSTRLKKVLKIRRNVHAVRMSAPILSVMFQPKAVGIIAFDGVTASHLATLHDVFTAASLQDGFGGSIACYRVWLLGLRGEWCTTDAGLSIQAETDLQSAPPLDTVLIPGG